MITFLTAVVTITLLTIGNIITAAWFGLSTSDVLLISSVELIGIIGFIMIKYVVKTLVQIGEI